MHVCVCVHVCMCRHVLYVYVNSYPQNAPDAILKEPAQSHLFRRSSPMMMGEAGAYFAHPQATRKNPAPLLYAQMPCNLSVNLPSMPIHRIRWPESSSGPIFCPSVHENDSEPAAPKKKIQTLSHDATDQQMAPACRGRLSACKSLMISGAFLSRRQS